MLLVGNVKIFVRKTSYLHLLLKSLRPDIRHAIIRQLNWRAASVEIKPKNSSGFLEKFLDEGRGASANQSAVAYRHNLDHHNQSQHVNRLKNSHDSSSRKIKSARAQELGEAVLECSKTLPAPVSRLDGIPSLRLDLMVLDVPNHNLHSYDPVYMVVKPLEHSSDDILAGQDNSPSEADVISRENYKVTLVWGSETLHCSSAPELNRRTASSQNASEIPEQGQEQDHSNKPNSEKLDNVYNRLRLVLPRFFVQPHDYSIYHPDVIFENNIRGLTTVGIAAYVKQLAVVRLVAHLKFAHVRMDVMKITKHPEDFTVRVRWRIRGISGLKMFLKIWKISLWNWKELLNQESDWYDGFSIFYVGKDGLVTRHVCDKMMPDEEKEVNLAKGLLATKLAFLLGLTQRPFLEDLDAMAIMLLKLEEMNYFARPVAK